VFSLSSASVGWQDIIVRSLGPNLCSLHGVRSVSHRRSVCFICYCPLYNLACRTGSRSGLELKLHMVCVNCMVEGTWGRSVSHVWSHWFTGFPMCLVTSDLSGYTSSSSIYVRLMADHEYRCPSIQGWSLVLVVTAESRLRYVFVLLEMQEGDGYGEMNQRVEVCFTFGYGSMPCCGLELYWIVDHGMGIREFANSDWIIDPPQFSFFVCTVKFSLQHLWYGLLVIQLLDLWDFPGGGLFCFTMLHAVSSVDFIFPDLLWTLYFLDMVFSALGNDVSLQILI